MKGITVLTIAIMAILFLSLGCVESREEVSPAPPKAERFTEEWSGAVGDGWMQVLHDNELNTTVYRSADGYGYQGLAVISDKEIGR